jgi:hypothetical protein
MLGTMGCGGSASGRPVAVAKPLIAKQAVIFAQRTFDPSAPPSDMPPLSEGENAECESNFTSDASVTGKTQRVDATHALVTVTNVRVSLGLKITIWVPVGVSEHVVDHEQGHRQISEHYYQTADKLAERIASGYMGRSQEVMGADLDAAADEWLKREAAEITADYDDQLDSNRAQAVYDNITDHSRNDIAAEDAVARALKDVTASLGQL